MSFSHSSPMSILDSVWHIVDKYVLSEMQQLSLVPSFLRAQNLVQANQSLISIFCTGRRRWSPFRGKTTSCSDSKLKTGVPGHTPQMLPAAPQLSPLSSSSGAFLDKYFIPVSSMGLPWKTLLFWREKKINMWVSKKWKHPVVWGIKSQKDCVTTSLCSLCYDFPNGRHHHCSPGHPQHQGNHSPIGSHYIFVE